jgi:Fibronectin type III domain/Concanavalin A-like lectin/glucanases superfamily/Sulfatase-modifying factor enzyme 1
MSSLSLRTLAKFMVSASFFAAISTCSKVSSLGFTAESMTSALGGFSGVSSIQISAEGKYLLTWNQTSITGDVSTTSYEVYMARWDSSQPVPKTSAKTAQVESLPGAQLVDLEPSLTPAVNGALIGSAKGVRSFTLSDNLVKGTTYTFQIRAIGSDGTSDSNNRVLFYNPDSRFFFTGLESSNVEAASDASQINLSWEPATGTVGTVKYVVYQDANFSTAIASTTATAYSYQNPTRGHSYTFSVRAFNGDTPDTNKKFVVVSVPDPSDKIPPVFAGLVSATTASDKKIVLKWKASPSSDISQYNIYYAGNLVTPVSSTEGTDYVVNGLTAGTSYTFTVRAKDASGNEDTNRVSKSAQTLSYSVPEFSGLTSVAAASGVAGLTSLTLSWPRGGSTTSGYKVYQSSSADGENFNSPLADIASSTTTSYTATGLSSNTKYYFVVRAYDSTLTPALFELNTVERSATTLPILAPTFSGLATASPGAGDLALTTVDLTWPAPSSDGVYDGFVTQYEIGTCAAGFSASPTEIMSSGDSLRSSTITGLTAQNNYRFRVRARYSPANIRDTNTTCKDAYTSPSAPVFAGISGLVQASGASGFTTATASWSVATGSFTYYKVEWATTATFDTPNVLTTISTIATTSRTITALPANTLVYVRVSAVYNNGITLSSGASQVLSVTTTPVAPTGEGPSTVQVLAADSLKVSWTAPTNFASALYNGYKLWSSCGASAPTTLLAKLSGAADSTYTSTQLNATFTGLASNTQCCYQVRAYYSDGANSLASTSTVNYQCQTPTLTAPSFSGVASVTNPNTASGFTTLTVNWAAVDVSEESLFSYYEISYATSISGQTWTGTTQISTRATTSATITGLTENTTYYFRVRAVNNNGTPSVNSGSDAVANATTTPRGPTGDSLSLATSVGSTKARLTYTPPSSVIATGGLFNSIFLFIQAGTTTDVSTYRTTAETGGITSGKISGFTISQAATLTSLPALIRIPYPGSEINADIANLIQLWGLNPNQQICVQAVAAYWVDGYPTKYLASSTPTTRCVTPSAGAPAFDGITSITSTGGTQDFTQMTVNWGTITGDCTGVDVSVTTTEGTPDFTTATFESVKDLSCSGSSVAVSGLSPYTTYHVQVRAKNMIGGVTYASGQSIELSQTTIPTTPTGDQITAASFVSVSKSPDTANLTWTLPSTGLWNKISVWRATGNGTTEATNAVLTASATKSDHTGPTTAPITQISVASPSSNTATTYSDTTVTDGQTTCYLVRAVFDNGLYYNSSANQTVQCGSTSYSAISFAGMSTTGSLASGNWSDGTAKIKLTFAAVPVGDIEEYWVYYSNSSSLSTFDFTSAPWQIVSYTDATYNPDTNNNYIYVGAQGRTYSGAGYYVVRAKHYGGPVTDTNTVVSNLVTVPTASSNFVYVSPAMSGLAYGYYIMNYEASLASGTYGADAVTSSELNLATCNTQFHVSKTMAHSSCGTKASSAKVQSLSAKTPTTATWHQAWTACRNSSPIGSVGTTGATTTAGGGGLWRMATEQEWRRASRWDSSNYSNMWTVYSGGTANCNTATGAIGNTGAGSSCVSNVGAFDMAGNTREWVDARMTSYDIANNSESRFSYGPVVGVVIKNGIDGLTKRYHNVTPSANNLALVLGSDYATPPNYQKQYDAETETWQDPTVSTTAAVPSRGFRCVAFPGASQTPTMAQMAQTNEPTYATSDNSGAASTWKIPENLYVKDVKPETVAITAPVPNTALLTVWNLNSTSASGNQTGLYTTTTTTLNGAGTALNSGVDGTSYYNSGSFNATVVDASSSGFTIGGWFKVPSGSSLQNAFYLGSSSAGGTNYLKVYTQSSRFKLQFDALSGAIVQSPASIDDGNWHHLAVTFTQGVGAKMYYDGLYVGTNNDQTSLAFTPSYLGFQNTDLSSNGMTMGALFYHPFTIYTASDVSTLNSYLSTNKYYPSSSLSLFTTNISWAPYTKQVCDPTCATSAETGFTYNLYRFVEPTRVDIRTRIPWAIASGPYSSNVPMDPLAVDNSGNRLCTSSTTTCKLIGTISGSACNSSTPSGCTYADSAAKSNGFAATTIYNYVLVARDSEGNNQVPRVQRYRSPYFVGQDSSGVASSAFRTEQRLRRASVFLVDEAYQQSATLQSNPQIMVHIPMDVSGLDHDFFIQKYEASTVSGSAVNNSPSGSATWPLQADASGNWVSNAGACNDLLLRTGSFGTGSLCGNGVASLNTTTIISQSKQNVAPTALVDQGVMWKACANTSIVDGGGFQYFEYQPSDSEWTKAADWGDVNLDGTIDQSAYGANIGLTVSSLESGAADTTTVRCNQDGSPAALYSTNSPQTANCRSRYGVADMVGNASENTNGQGLGAAGYDNGTDGLWSGTTRLIAYTSLNGLKFDLLRGFPTPLDGATLGATANMHYAPSVSLFYGTTRGGSPDQTLGKSGRWYIHANTAPTYTSTYTGGRCRR